MGGVEKAAWTGELEEDQSEEDEDCTIGRPFPLMLLEYSNVVV
jgi:hypothetical protein